MVDAVGLTADQQLLEIGPGQGVLTERFYGHPKRFVAVEIDRDLAPRLAQTYPQLEVVTADVLKTDLAALLASGTWRVVGNLPYNVSTPLLLRLLNHMPLITDMHFMLQKEVGERLAASPGTKAWGRLSILVQYFCAVDLLFEVPPSAFAPPPKVDSVVLALRPHPERLPLTDSTMLQDVVRIAFQQRRKRLANALKSLEIDWDRTNIDNNQRPDQLSVADYVTLANLLSSTKAS